VAELHEDESEARSTGRGADESRVGRAPGSQSARRLLEILSLFTGDHPVNSIDALAAGAGVPRSSVYRFVGLLREYGLVEADGSGSYHLGPQAITMGYVARSLVNMADLWRPVLDRLVAATNETALVLRRVGNFAVCVDRMESEQPVRLSFEVGRTMPLHQGAGAKVLLAFSPEGFRRRYLDDLVARPSRAGLRAELDVIVASGLGESAGEVDPGIWAVAAPLGEAGADPPLALSVAVPDYRLDDERRRQVRSAVSEAAHHLRQQMHPYV